MRKRRIVSLLLALVMVLSMLPTFTVVGAEEPNVLKYVFS